MGNKRRRSDRRKKEKEKLLRKRGSVSDRAERRRSEEVVLQLKHEGQEGRSLHWEEATASGKFLRQETQINMMRKQTEGQ